MIPIPERVKTLQPYLPGKPIEELAREKGLNKIVKLASNENPLGPSPKAIEAIRNCLSNSHRYVEPTSPELIAALARKFNKKTGQIICGHGTDALLGYILKTFTEQNEEVLTSQGTFIGIYVNTKKIGRKLSLAPLKNYAYDLDGILKRIRPETRVIYLANPNNPTGTIFSREEFEKFMSKVPKEILVILDEAYAVYAASYPEYPDGMKYDYENLIVTRTFSKSYGLAGLRIGFAVAPEYLIREMYKVKLPFEPNYLAQKAALASLEDGEFLQRTIQANRKSMERLALGFERLGIEYVPSTANFYVLLFPSDRFAEDFFQECLNLGLIVRPVRSFGIPEGIRINSGTEEETTFALEVIEKVHQKLSKQNGETKRVSEVATK
jgi:histidinol-phosphate aminotransferase